MYLQTSPLYALKGHKSKWLKRRTINNVNDGLKETQNSETGVRELNDSSERNKIEKRKRDKSAKEIMITSQSSSYGPNWAHIFRY